MIEVVDETRRAENLALDIPRSLAFNEGIELIRNASSKIRLYLDLCNESVRTYWHSRHMHLLHEATPDLAIDFIKEIVLRDGHYALTTDLSINDWNVDGRRVRTSTLTFESLEIYGQLGGKFTLDDFGPSKSQTISFYEISDLPGLRNLLRRRRHSRVA